MKSSSMTFTIRLQVIALAGAILSIRTANAQGAADPDANSPKPPPLKTSVTVNSVLSSETPAAITTLGAQQLQLIPGAELDDRLRQIPGFSLFRRSSSVVANPTTQGVSLRATGSTGASRTLVLWDGIPINDPFGGWVYWDRIDPSYIDRVEVQRGGSTSIFGDRAMGGTVSLFSPPQQPEHLFAQILRGSEGTADVAAGYSNLWGHWGLSVHSRAFTTDGYYITPNSIRGNADNKANVRFAAGDMHLDYLGAHDRFSLHFDALAEARHNGTQLTHNSTGLGTIGASYTHSWTNDQISVIVFHTQEQFHSTFSSVSANRNTEALTSKQTVPVLDTGGAAYWQHHAKRWNTIVGTDADHVDGTSFDYSYSTRVLTPNGGTLFEHGVFGQGDVLVGPVRFFAGIRQQFTGQHGQTFVSPNAGAAFGVRRFRFRASGYRSFRAPTLNELYRPFRVGNAQTLANPALVPESLTGVEAGFDWSGETTRISFTAFRNELENLIDNATLSTSPALILRQRQNFPSALSRGLEASINRQWPHWRAEAGYMYADARLSTGQRIPQVPRQQGTAQLSYTAKSTRISGGLRVFGLIFDDDLNQFLMPGFASVGMSAEQQLTKSLSAVASVDNLLDRTYLVALTPNPNIGQPQMWRVGLKWNGRLR
ncbi:MAG TPA: TonB-dependent receptor [Bryobacteraceae bacterium]|nr:TonB-dependent receptor [Bryobacteraceae bacterium]